MAGVRYVLANYLTGKIITEVPVTAGATWALALNKADSVACTIDFKDPGVAALDPRSITEPRKTILLAVTQNDVVLGWGRIDPKRTWNAGDRTLDITASGAWAYWDNCIIGTNAMRTTALTVGGQPNTALDRTVSGADLATIGKRLMQDRLGWPGATMPYSFFADRTGSRQMTYSALDFKTIGSALNDLVERENGPDFDFTATLNSDGLGYSYPVRAGTEAAPYLGAYIGTWSMNGDASVIDDIQVDDDFTDFAVAVFAKSQGQSGNRQITYTSRVLNETLRVNGGYPPEDYVDTTHSDVNVQATLDAYAAEDATYAGKYQRSFSFSVATYHQNGTVAQPTFGSYRCGDYVDLDFDGDDYMGSQVVRARILSMSGNVDGRWTKITVQAVS